METGKLISKCSIVHPYQLAAFPMDPFPLLFGGAVRRSPPRISTPPLVFQIKLFRMCHESLLGEVRGERATSDLDIQMHTEGDGGGETRYPDGIHLDLSPFPSYPPSYLDSHRLYRLPRMF